MHGPDLSLPVTNPVMIFSIVLLIILILPILFQRIRIPGMVGLIVAGVIIGPHALGILERDATIELLGTVGLLYIMFIAGLEVDMNEFKKYRNRSIGFGTLTFILPQGIGTLMGYYILGFPWTSAILIGAVFASHTLLAYPIISRMGLAKIPSVTTAVGATIITDTAALLVLAVVVRSTEGELGPMFWVQMSVLLTFFVVGILWGVPRLGQWFFTKVSSNGIAEFVFVLAVVFVSAVVAEFIGVEAIIGAFLAGLALNRLVPEHSTLMNRTQFVGDALFIPFFLISVGMLVDVRILVAGVDAWIVAIAMLTTVTITKWMASMATIPLFKHTKDEAWTVFGLTIPQAAATLATVIIGYNVGLFDDAVLNGTILMILVTCMVGPYVAERWGRKVALQRENEPYERSSAPQRILVPLANPSTAQHLMDLALMIRQTTSEQPIHPLIVVQNTTDPEAGVARGEKLLGQITVHATAANVPVNPMVRLDPNIAHGIYRAIQERIISTVIIGWNGESSGREIVFGSVLDQLLIDSKELVLVSKLERPSNTLDRILLAVPPYAHREPGFAEVVATIKTLASQTGASIVLFHVSDQSDMVDALTRAKPEVPIASVPLEDWAGLVSALDEEVASDDLLFVMSSRQGTISWRPALNRLPRVLARRFPQNSLVVSYGSLKSVQDRMDGQPGSNTVLADALEVQRVSLDLRLSETGGIFESLMEHDETYSDLLKRHIIEELEQIEPAYVPEILPGVVLFHAHVRGIDKQAVFLGVSADGVKLERTSNMVHAVVVVLSPVGIPPEQHLRLLTLVARAFRSDEYLHEVLASESPGEAREYILGHVRRDIGGASPETVRQQLADVEPKVALSDDIAPHQKETHNEQSVDPEKP
jgi:Kef-type K+ transport system membrane component KefB/mannitol/fructose-specific phosphotransferase system IIA component (Ntr-type)